MRRPRFSLRTLLLGVLALGAAVTLWRNYEPWRIDSVFAFSPDTDPMKSYVTSFSPDGKWISAETLGETSPGVWRQASVIWNVESGRVFRVFHDIDSAWSSESEFSADSTVLLSESANKKQYSVKLWDVANQREIKIPELAAFAQAAVTTSSPLSMKRVQLSPDSRHMLVKTQDNSAQLINIETKNVLASIPDIRDAIFSTSGAQVAMHSADGTLRVHETKTGRETARIIPPVDWDVTRLRYCSNRLLMVSASPTEGGTLDWGEQSALSYDLENLGEPAVFIGELDWRANVSADDALAVFSDQREFRVIDLRTQQLISRGPSSIREILEWPKGNALIFNIDNGSLYETSTGRLIYKIDGAFTAIPSPSHQRALCDSQGRYDCRLCDMTTGKVLQVLPHERTGVFYLPCFSPNDSHFVTQNTDTHAIRIWTRHRPEYWWGLAWLPEFWLTLVLTLLFVASLRRDFKSR